MNRSIKVLAFIEATVVNGAAKTLLNFCDSLAQSSARSQVSVSIATFHRGAVPNGSAPNEFVRTARAHGVPVHVIPERFAFDPQLFGSVRRVVDGVRPDILQTNNVKSHLLTAISAARKGRRWIAFHHGYTATDLKVKVYNQFDRFSLRKADLVVTVCGPFREQLITSGVSKDKVRVLHNSVALPARPNREQSTRLRQQLGIAEDSKILITVGRLSLEKGHADLLQALAIVARTVPDLDWKLVVVGSGPEKAKLQDLASELGIAQRVIFTGQQADTLPFYWIADLMVLPSRSEGSPHVVLEAMACGVPIIASRVGGVPEIVADRESARLTPARDPEALAHAITEMLREPESALRYAAVAKDRLAKHFTHETYRDSLLSMYEELLAAKEAA